MNFIKIEIKSRSSVGLKVQSCNFKLQIHSVNANILI